MQEGIYLKGVPTGEPEYPGAEVITMSYGQVAVLRKCLKCQECGYSVATGPTASIVPGSELDAKACAPD